MDINEINRLAAAGSAMRPDWPAKSLATFLGKNLADRAYGDVAVALAWICTRTKTNTPTLDELAFRTSPATLKAKGREAFVRFLQTPAGKATVAGAGLLITLVVVNKIRSRNRD